MLIELWPLTLQSLETIAMSLVGVGAFFYYAWKKFQDIRGKASDKKEKVSAPDALIAVIQAERAEAVRQRDEARKIAEELKTINTELRDKMRGLSDDVQDLKSQLRLITELNRRLAQSLDSQRQ